MSIQTIRFNYLFTTNSNSIRWHDSGAWESFLHSATELHVLLLFLFHSLSPWCLSDSIFVPEWKGESLSAFPVECTHFPLFLFLSLSGSGSPSPPSTHLPVHSQWIQTRQVAPSRWGWSLGSSRTGRSQHPALTARGASTRSHGTLSSPGWTNRERPTPGLLRTAVAPNGSRLENVTVES